MPRYLEKKNPVIPVAPGRRLAHRIETLNELVIRHAPYVIIANQVRMVVEAQSAVLTDTTRVLEKANLYLLRLAAQMAPPEEETPQA